MARPQWLFHDPDGESWVVQRTAAYDRDALMIAQECNIPEGTKYIDNIPHFRVPCSAVKDRPGMWNTDKAFWLLMEQLGKVPALETK
jgi:hypothetical protein